jgi:hypothetical protein
MVAARYNPQLKHFRDKLVAAGKPKGCGERSSDQAGKRSPNIGSPPMAANPRLTNKTRLV